MPAAWRIESGDLRAEVESSSETPPFDIDYQENVALPAWRAFEAEFASRFPGFIDNFLNSGTYAPSNWDTNWSFSGATNTEDNTSKGYEIEFTANPIDQLRILINASKTEAIRDNVPGDTAAAIYAFIQESMWNGTTKTDAGNMRKGYGWNNFNDSDSMADWWLSTTWTNYAIVRALNGQKTPEVVEWRVNAVANYTFTDGFMKGAGVGGAYRYQSGTSLGYTYYFDEQGIPVADITNPMEGPSSDRYDVWFRYRRPLFEGKVDMTLQLNIYNVFGDNELIPVRNNPDGTTALWRIQDGRSWKFTTSFNF